MAIPNQFHGIMVIALMPSGKKNASEMQKAMIFATFLALILGDELGGELLFHCGNGLHANILFSANLKYAIYLRFACFLA